jgi:hypothetical protein
MITHPKSPSIHLLNRIQPWSKMIVVLVLILGTTTLVPRTYG